MTHEQLENRAWAHLWALLDEADALTERRKKKALASGGDLHRRLVRATVDLCKMREGKTPATVVVLKGKQIYFWTGEWKYYRPAANPHPHRVPIYRAIGGQTLHDGHQLERLPKKAGGGV